MLHYPLHRQILGIQPYCWLSADRAGLTFAASRSVQGFPRGGQPAVWAGSCAGGRLGLARLFRLAASVARFRQIQLQIRRRCM